VKKNKSRQIGLQSFFYRISSRPRPWNTPTRWTVMNNFSKGANRSCFVKKQRLNTLLHTTLTVYPLFVGKYSNFETILNQNLFYEKSTNIYNTKKNITNIYFRIYPLILILYRRYYSTKNSFFTYAWGFFTTVYNK
jgi:hypothetical protein